MTRLNFFTKRLHKINDHTEEWTLKESNRFIYSKDYELRDTLFADNDTTQYSRLRKSPTMERKRNDVLEINRETPWDIKENRQTKLWHFVIQRVLHFVSLEERSFYWNERLVYSAVQMFKKEGELIVGEEEEKKEEKGEESLGRYRNGLVKDFRGRGNKLLVGENAKRMCSGLDFY